MSVPKAPGGCDPESAFRDSLRTCEQVQVMIDINSDHLDTLRGNVGENTALPKLTKEEIRNLERKLIGLFSEQMAVRASVLKTAASEGVSSPSLLAFQRYPSQSQWLRVVGISPESKKVLEAKVASVDQLKEKTDAELQRLLLAAQSPLPVTQRMEDFRRLQKALQGLRKYSDALVTNGRPSPQEAAKWELHWDSWCRASASSLSSSSTTSSSSTFVSNPPSSTSSLECSASSSSSSPKPETAGTTYVYNTVQPGNMSMLPPKPDSGESSLSSTSSLASSLPPPSPGLTLSPPVVNWPEKKLTPPTTPPWSAAVSIFGPKLQKEQKFPTTPPPSKKHYIAASHSGSTNKVVAAAAAAAAASDYPLTKSRSHEGELAHRVHPAGGQMSQPQPAASTAMSASAAMTASTSSASDHRLATSASSSAVISSAHESVRSARGSISHVVVDDEDEEDGESASSPSTPSALVNSLVGTIPIAHGAGKRPRLPTFSESSSTVATGDESVTDSTASPLPSPSPFDASLDSGSSVGSQSLQVPKSPRTPRSMGHTIRHRFKKTMKPARCGHCSEVMITGLKCKECKFKCHRHCEPNVPPACSIPEGFVNFYVKQMTKEGSPILPHMRTQAGGPGIPGFPSGVTDFRLDHRGMARGPAGTKGDGSYPDSSSNTSSCNSSTPSSPAVVVTSSHRTPPHSASMYSKGTKFTFPDPPGTLKLHSTVAGGAGQSGLHPQSAGGGFGGGGIGATLFPHHQQPQKITSPNPIIDSVKSYDSDKTLSGTSGSSGSAGTAYRLDSQDSTASVDDSSSTWTAGRQTSISLREWDIPYEELTIGDKIGSGRFSTVHQGNWHGDVAIKILNMENTDDADATLEAFRLDVSTFRKTRHENLILFMGACMNPPKLAIVTSLCKGNTLYTLLHLRKDKFPINKLIIIAQQIAQGMGYLHHRGIVHKDLKTKNIFLENGHAIIADFGLVNVARRLCAHQGQGPESTLQSKESMSIPKGWLCYLAPEIMRALRVRPDEGEDLPFTKASDVFAFGTVWFELLTGEWPWKHAPPETIIWLVGRGMEPSLANLQASKDVKDVLLACWAFVAEQRPDFTSLFHLLDAIPKKRGLIRSPSHPVHLWRSAESVF